MRGAGIFDGDLLVIDRGITPQSDDIVTRDITDAVLRIFERIWRDGYGWRKAGVLLVDLP